MAENTAGAGFGDFAFGDGGLPVDDDVIEADGIGVGGLIGGRILDLFGVEKDEVGGEAFAELATVLEVESPGGERGHAADGVFEGEDFAFPDVLGQNARVGAVAAGMGHADAEIADAGVAGDGRIGVAEDALHIFVTHGVIDHLSAAFLDHVEDSFGFWLTFDVGDFRDVFTFVVLVGTISGDDGLGVVRVAEVLKTREHFAGDALTSSGGLQTFRDGGLAVGEGPTGEGDTEVGGGVIVGVLIDYDVYSFAAELLDEGDCFLRIAPNGGGIDFEVGDLDPEAGLFANSDGLGDRFLHLAAFVAHMAGVDGVVLAGGLGESDDFGGIGEGAGDVD